MELISRQTAKAQGLKRYRTGKPCKRGHVAERFVSTAQCSVCVGRQANDWKKANRQIATAMSRNWRERNREKVRELKRTYYATSESERQLQKKRGRKWMESNREKYRASSARWRVANLDVAAAAQQRRRAKKLKCLPPWADLEKIQQFYAQAKELTEMTGVKHNVDHIYPLQGDLVTGLHVEWNLQILTERDNKSKGARLPEVWRTAAL